MYTNIMCSIGSVHIARIVSRDWSSQSQPGTHSLSLVFPLEVPFSSALLFSLSFAREAYIVNRFLIEYARIMSSSFRYH